jgi:hypothetical protein
VRDDSWQFRTTEGVVPVHEDALGVRLPPLTLLAAWADHWRDGGLRERAWVSFDALALLFCLAAVVWLSLRLSAAGLTPRSLPDVALLAG